MSSKRERTRTSILEAAWKRVAQPGDPARLEDIAADAGVTRQSVYLHFGSRSGLLGALVDYIDNQIELPRMIGEAFANPDPSRALLQMLRTSAAVAPKIHGVAMALVRMAPTDEDAASAIGDRLTLRRKGLTELATRIAAADKLAADWTPKHVGEALWAAIAPENYELLVVDRGWSNKQYERWLQHLARSFLVDPPADD